MTANGSVKTSKTYISHLEKELNEEKVAREKLEQEIEELKRINSEITSKLGISIKWYWFFINIKIKYVKLS